MSATTSAAVVPLAVPARGRGPAGSGVRLARCLGRAVRGGLAATTLLDVVAARRGAGEVALCAAFLAALWAVQAPGSGRARRWSGRRRAAALGVQAVLTFGPVLWFGAAWGWMAGPLAGSVLLLVPGRAACVLCAVTVAAFPAWLAGRGADPATVWRAALGTAVAGLVLWGLDRLAGLLAEAEARAGEAGAELARRAVARERERFARDVHDLLGFGLSAVTLKAELALRLAAADPGAARAELASLVALARRALADVRRLAAGYRALSLAREAAVAAEVLAAAGVAAEVRVGGYGAPHPAVDTLLATALREGVTNVLRHSAARRCAVTAWRAGGWVRLSLVNDGASGGRWGAPCGAAGVTAGGGSGLDSLAERFRAAGGRLTARRDGDAFALIAELPWHGGREGADGCAG